MTYQEVIRNIVRVRSKHQEKLCGDCKVSKQDFSEVKGPAVAQNGTDGPSERSWETY